MAAIELVSPGNKDREGHRHAFAIKCASYLCQGVSLVVIDIVTSRQANLHDEMMQILGHGNAFALPSETALYAVAYRPIVRDQQEQIEVWPSPLEVGRNSARAPPGAERRTLSPDRPGSDIHGRASTAPAGMRRDCRLGRVSEGPREQWKKLRRDRAWAGTPW